ncbi:MAG: hypothetical protein ACRYFU_16735 [Janthinobacterium lividum]
MRILISLLISTSTVLGTQQSNTAPKMFTPEQLAAQKRYAVYEAKRTQLRALAEDAFKAEMILEKKGDCTSAQTDYEFNVCFGRAVDVADQHMKTYEQALSQLLVLEPPGATLSNTPSMPGPAGPSRTPAQDLIEFQNIEELWHTYLKAAPEAAFHQFDGGTGGPSFELETHLRLVRDHLRELNDIYGMTLTL